MSGGKIRSKSNPDNALPFGRVAGTSHWSPVMLPEGMAPALSETGVWNPPELEPPSSDDRINTSLTYGFVFDMCGIEIDPVTYQVKVDRYVSMHDAGKILNPLIADGQMRGAFAQGIAAALYEEFVTNEEGAFLTGTFADYLVPTVSEIPPVEMLHIEIAVAVHAARRQGPGRRQLHERAGLHRQRHRRRARRQGRAAAGDAAAHPCADGAERRRAMKPRPFDYVRPDTVDEAVALLAEHGDEARILAGGQSLMAMMNLRLADPAMLIDIARIAELGAHPRSRRHDRGRRRGDAEQAAGLAGPEEEAAAARRRPALRRPFPDPQQGHGLRLDRARRSELGNSAVARDAAKARWCCAASAASACWRRRISSST